MPLPIDSAGEPLDRSDRLRRAVLSVVAQRTTGLFVADEVVLAEHADLLPELAEELHKLRCIHHALDEAQEEVCREALERLQADLAAEDADTDGEGPPASGFRAPARGGAPEDVPERIGRYRVLRPLAEGGFGRVYLARDDELARNVAIKLPQGHRVLRPQDLELYLAEARIAAELDHPAIVPVYDVGRTDDGHWYVVSKLILGQDLASRLRRSRLSQEEAVRITLTVAEALHHAHTHGLVHRDIKPANILLDADGRPFVTDFGLALREEDASVGRSFAGTPAYMSPEQARGEAHRVDARSDIFSLGIVFYETLTGQRPFQSVGYESLMEEIARCEPRPPRAADPLVPEEVERICLRALAKRASDRYASAAEFAEDLRHCLAGLAPQDAPLETVGPATAAPPTPASSSHRTPARVVPKGLRSFDADDADFFIDLVPGPRDRTGLPESIRHWKQRLEATAPDEPFAVGVLYGPSGCGKSSLMRAGVLPRLAPHVQAVYVDATAEDTEERLRQRIVVKCPGLPDDLRLAPCLAEVRRGHGLAAGRKLLLVIDQFEQWLHSRSEDEQRPLVEALRQCDGSRLQCLLLVRDEFWLAISRLMAELEVELIQGRNTDLVDLFDATHARKVLTEFGVAYRQLPDNPVDWTSAHEAFLQSAVAGLAQDGRVVPVRLALFAEMIKARPWTPATLRDVGGAEGIGVAFLEATFSARTAPIQYRQHQRAARAVFEALLPEPGSELRGRVCSYPQLLDLSGYGMNPRAFKELMRILDAETRLVTPVDREAEDGGGTPARPGQRYYQLTHDYLVPSLREWLRRKRKSTLAGRAELRLAERAALWGAKPESRQLPSLGEWLAIRVLTRKADWSSPQRTMMRAAGRRYLRAAGVLAALALVLLWVGGDAFEWVRRAQMQLRAGMAGVFLAVGREQSVWPQLKHSPDPTLRTRLIHSLDPMLLGPAEIVRRAEQQGDVSVRRAMVLLAGEIEATAQAERRKDSLGRAAEPAPEMIQELLRLYRDDPDPGIHAAAEWTLRQFRQDPAIDGIDREFASGAIVGERQWYVNAQGHTLVVIPGPAEFVMGSPPTEPGRNEDETQRPQRISRSFSLATKETTVGQFQQFQREQPLPGSSREVGGTAALRAPRTPVFWYAAAAYCNWLSRKAGLTEDQWCYLPNAEGHYAEGMRIAPDCLYRRGYRLPTEAEWEYACRAHAETAYSFGESAALLPKYGWCQVRAAVEPLAVGSLKPNDFGLFDMHGNAAEWCQDRSRVRAGTAADASLARATTAEEAPVQDSDLRVLRGGSFHRSPAQLRSAARVVGTSAEWPVGAGFRIARSYP